MWERTRWFFNVEVKRQPDDPFRLNDWYKEYYARLIMRQEEDLKDFFETRVSVADTMFGADQASTDALNRGCVPSTSDS